MFGFIKLSGAPPRAFQAYRASNEPVEKAIIEDLYKKYDQLIREEEINYKKSVEILKSHGSGGYNKETEKKFILSNTFRRLFDYGLEKGYSEFLISLFYQGF